MSTEVGQLHHTLSLDDSKFKSALKDSTNDMHRLESNLKNMGSSMQSAGLKMSAMFTLPIMGGATLAVKSALESNKVLAQTEAVIKSTGGVAGYSAEQVNKLAKSLQKSTLYSDEQVASAQNMLLTFTRIGGDTMPRATQAVADMATAMGTDLTQTSIQVGKALQDPIQGVTALQRVGVRLTEQQKEQVKVMVEAGDVAGAQALILKELETEFGGSAESAKKATGPMDDFKDTIEDLSEDIGNQILPYLNKLAEKLKGVADWFANLSPKTKDIILVFAGVVAVAGPLLVILGTLINAISAIAGVLGGLSIPIVLIIAGIGLLVAGLIWLENKFGIVSFAISKLVEVATALWTLFKTYLLPIFTALWQFIVSSFKVAWEQLIDAYNRIKKALEPVMPQLIWLLKIIGAVSLIITGTFIVALVAVIAIIGGLIGVIARLIGWIAQLVSWVFKISGEFYNAGRAIIQGLINGIKSKWSEAVNNVKNLMSALRRLLPFSPAKEGPFSGKGWTLYSGQSIMQGLADGINKSANLPKSAIAGALSGVNANISGNINSEPSNNISNTTATFNGNIILNSKDAVDEFYKRLGRGNELAQKGMAT